MWYKLNELNIITKVGSGAYTGDDGYREGDSVAVDGFQITGLFNRPIPRATIRELLLELSIPERDRLFESDDKKVVATVQKLMAYGTFGIKVAVNSTLLDTLAYLEARGVLDPPTGPDLERAEEIYISLGGEIQ